jgi:peptidoglycan-associated lipoprotein
MSYHPVASTRAAFAAAALTSFAILSGCTSTGASENRTPAAANANPEAGALIGTPSPDQDFRARLAGVGDRVHFALDRYDLSPEAESTLRKQAALLQSYPQVAVMIEGHADERGTREYNLALGERRADTVRNYLVALGVAGDRIAVISYGKERPECPEAAEGC